jgi:hypothetical protein
LLCRISARINLIWSQSANSTRKQSISELTNFAGLTLGALEQVANTIPIAFFQSAHAMARELKRRNRQSIIEIRDRSNGRKVIMLEDGRTG